MTATGDDNCRKLVRPSHLDRSLDCKYDSVVGLVSCGRPNTDLDFDLDLEYFDLDYLALNQQSVIRV